MPAGWKAALTLALGAICALALLALLPILKEGIGPEDFPRLLGVTAVLYALALGWSLACYRRTAWGWLAAGWAILALPLLIYTLTSAEILKNQATARRIERSARIEQFRETPILWPGFNGPVGLKIEMDLIHAGGPEGNLLSPKIRMGNSELLTYKDYDSSAFWEFQQGFLTEPLFPLPGTYQEQMARLKRERQVFMDPSPAHLAYELFPGNVREKPLPGRICLKPDGMKQIAYSDGSDLSVSWYFAAPGGLRVDLSQLLTQSLRTHSAFQGRVEAWNGILQRVEAPALRATGYRPCGNADSQIMEICLCRGA